jgi:hypothetical protein
MPECSILDQSKKLARDKRPSFISLRHQGQRKKFNNIDTSQKAWVSLISDGGTPKADGNLTRVSTMESFDSLPPLLVRQEARSRKRYCMKRCFRI